MKKILIATTALVATAGVAAAEVTIGGAARFGVKYNSGNSDANTPSRTVAGTNLTTEVSGEDANGNDITGTIPRNDQNVTVPGSSGSRNVYLESRFRANIDAKATTDAGVAFSARVRMQGQSSATGDNNGLATLNAPRYSVEAGGLRLDVGNAGGALDNLPGYYGVGIGLTGLFDANKYEQTGFAGYSSGGGGDNNTLYARYANGGLAVAASYTQSGIDAGHQWDLHGAYSFNNFTAALGYGKDFNDDKQTVLTLQYGAGAFSVSGLVGRDDLSGKDNNTFYGLGGTYDVNGALSLAASYAGGNVYSGATGYSANSFGIGATYSLGGGVSIKGGVASVGRLNDAGNGSSQDTLADLGVNFSF